VKGGFPHVEKSQTKTPRTKEKEIVAQTASEGEMAGWRKVEGKRGKQKEL